MLLGELLSSGISSPPSSRCSSREDTQNAVSCVVRREVGGARGEESRWAGVNLASHLPTYPTDQAVSSVVRINRSDQRYAGNRDASRRPRLSSEHVALAV